MPVLTLLLVQIALARPIPSDFEARVLPVLRESCLECHSGPQPKGELDLAAFANEKDARERPELWRAVRARVAAGEMPPAKRPRLAEAESDALLDWIDSVPGAGLPPGRTVLRRLNRREYENSVRDLLGVDFDGRERLPADDVGAGFDVLGSALSLPDSALEKYVQAAEEIAARAIVIEDPAGPHRERHDARELEGGAPAGKGGLRTLSSNGEVSCEVLLPRAGEYVVRAHACASQAGPELARMALRAGKHELERFEVAAVRPEPQSYETRATLRAGRQRISASFLNDYWMPDDPDPAQRDRNLHLAWLEVEGPLDAPVLSAYQRTELAGADPAALPAEVERLATRAWRRPASAGEVAELLALGAPGDPPLARVRDALVAILSSPRFLFRLEPDPPGFAPGSLRRLGAWELAARLSYFLWSSTPDELLLEAARSGALLSEAGLERELERMLDDPRSGELARGFAPQWLQIEALERAAPDAARFPAFDEGLRASMRAETQAFFEAIQRERRPLVELLDSDFAFVDERLAKLYGIPGVRGPGLRRVRVDRATRGGLLGQASVLTVTSNPTRTSPVKRGKWVLEVLLDAPPPPPPPGVGVLEETARALSVASLRERLELHRAKAECAVCHDRLDPLGLALENYDAIGVWRERDGGLPVDASGVMPDGRRVQGRVELLALLRADGALTRSLARRLLVYALGRELGSDDERALRALVRGLPGAKTTLHDLLRAIVLGEPFRTARVAEGRG